MDAARSSERLANEYDAHRRDTSGKRTAFFFLRLNDEGPEQQNATLA